MTLVTYPSQFHWTQELLGALSLRCCSAFPSIFHSKTFILMSVLIWIWNHLKLTLDTNSLVIAKLKPHFVLPRMMIWEQRWRQDEESTYSWGSDGDLQFGRCLSFFLFDEVYWSLCSNLLERLQGVVVRSTAPQQLLALLLIQTPLSASRRNFESSSNTSNMHGIQADTATSILSLVNMISRMYISWPSGRKWL